MGYHVEIVRTRAGVSEPIREEEIRELIGRMPGLSVEPPQKFGDLMVVVSVSPNTYHWLLQHGKIWTKNPDEDEIALMLVLAGHLGARVRGDDLETYETADRAYDHPDDEGLRKEATAAEARFLRETGLKQVLFHVAVVAFFVVMVILLAPFNKK
jgi:hypothetical protein